MKLVPFYIRKVNRGHLSVSQLCVFLSQAGRRIWQTDEPGDLSEKQILDDYCLPNGFVVRNILRETAVAYIEIDPTQTRLSDFYTWEEALAHAEKPECWRPFYSIVDVDGKEWWSPKGIPEAELADYGAVSSLCSKLCSLVES